MNAELIEDLRATTRQALSAGGGGDLVDELDLVGLLVDSERGGLGLGDREMVLVGTELGRALSSSRFLPTAVLGATLLAHGDTDAAVEVLAGLVAGDSRCAVALAGADASWALSTVPVAATSTGDGGWALSGTAWGISTPSPPDTMLTVAAIDDGAALFAVAADHADVTPADQLDPARGLIEVAFSQSPARLLSGRDGTATGIAEAYRRGLLAVAADQLGVARTCLETAVEYAKTRNQFGAPIGSFQGIKHRCAEVLLDVELADAVVDQAVQTGAAVDAELAFIVATRAALSAAESCIHIHGGMGFTWEHPAHRFLRRARVNATLMGPPAVHRDAIAASAGLTRGGPEVIDELTLLRIVAIKGRASADMVAGSLAADPLAVQAALDGFTERELVKSTPMGYRITPAGRVRCTELLTAEHHRTDRSAVTAVYETFCKHNQELKAIITDWQTRNPDEPNDHCDPDYDQAVLDRLIGLHQQVLPLLDQIAEMTPRLSHYRPRLERAADAVAARDHTYVSRPIVDSYHTVWFELHEDLIGLAGLTRAGEAEAGRGA